VTARSRHLSEDRLADCYFTARAGERLDPPSAEHLAGCGPCAQRYAELTRMLETLGAEAVDDTDAVFTRERLRAQQQQIAERLQHVGRAARVISFPAHTVHHRDDGERTPFRLRWVAAAAAAAGIIIGIGAGVFLESQSHGQPTHQSAALTRPARSVPHAEPLMPASEAADDRFMSELETALDRPRTRELAPFDALTPHVREVSNVR